MTFTHSHTVVVTTALAMVELVSLAIFPAERQSALWHRNPGMRNFDMYFGTYTLF